MDQQEIVASFEDRARALGLPIASLCAKAGIAASTFSRWKRSDRNPKPVSMTLSSMGAVERVLADGERSVHAVADTALQRESSTGNQDDMSGQEAA